MKKVEKLTDKELRAQIKLQKWYVPRYPNERHKQKLAELEAESARRRVGL